MNPAPDRTSADHDLLIILTTDVRYIKDALIGTASQEGLCTTIDRHEKILTKHAVYFAILGATVVVIVPFLTWLIEKIWGS